MDEIRPTRDVYEAVADPIRRKLLQLLADVDESAINVLTVHFKMGRTAVSNIWLS